MPGQHGKPRDWLVLLILSVLGMVLGNPRYPIGGWLVASVRAVLLPPQSGVNGALEGVGHFFTGLVTAPARSKEYDRLRARAESAHALQARVWELEKENSRLKEILATLPSLPNNPLAAGVIARYPNTMTVTLSVGSRHHVHVGNPVVTPRGLAGIVASVSGGTCQVLMNTSDRLSVGARIARAESRTAGIVSGGQGDLLLMDHLPETAIVAVGDTVVTSGIGTLYPKGILIGTVTRVWKDPSYGLLRAWIKPAVRHDALEEAIVLR